MNSDGASTPRVGDLLPPEVAGAPAYPPAHAALQHSYRASLYRLGTAEVEALLIHPPPQTVTSARLQGLPGRTGVSKRRHDPHPCASQGGLGTLNPLSAL